MKRHWKRIVSMLLVGTMLAQVLAFAIEIPVNEVSVTAEEDIFSAESAQRLKAFAKGKTLKDTYMTTIQDDGSVKVVLKGYAYVGGDVCFQQFENDVLTADSYSDHSKGKVTSYSREDKEESMNITTASVGEDPDDDSNDIGVNEDEDNDDDIADGLSDSDSLLNSEIALMSSTPFTRKGKILYKLNGQVGTYGVHVAYKTTKRQKISYNVNGRYKRAAALAAILCDALLIPLDAGPAIAKTILQTCGVSAAATNFVLPDYYVESTRTTRHWRLRQMHNTSNERIMKGRRYHITGKNYKGKKNFYTGSYYRPSEFNNKSPELAAAIVERIYNPYSWSVSSWEVY